MSTSRPCDHSMLAIQYVWSLIDICKVVLTQWTTINTTLDCVTWGEIHNTSYDGELFAKPNVTLAIG